MILVQPETHPPLIRPAIAADLPRVAQIWAGNQDDVALASGFVPSLYVHELATRELVVAEDDGQVVGFAALLTRGDISFLADLFVDPARQSSGLGRKLLQYVLPRDARMCCTLSSSDPRALSLYIRAGLRPYWSCFQLRGSAALFAQTSSEEPDVVEAPTGDPELVEWDRTIGGRFRPEDHAYWVEQRGGVPLWFVRHGQRVGYGYVQTRSDDVLGGPETLTVGPIGVRSEADALPCVTAAGRWASDRATAIRVSVPGPHPALGPLLALGLRIHDIDTFCSTHAAPFTDVSRYLPSGGDLF
jgi:GNAT superfamily N-acetyltransferase